MIKKFLVSKTEETHIQFFRYFIVGGTAAVFDTGTLYLLTEYFEIYYLISAVIGFVLGLIINYVLCKLWIFNKTKYSRKKEFAYFVLIGIIGLGLNVFIIWFCSSVLLIWYMYSKIIAIILVFFWNFIARKYLLFTDKKTKYPASNQKSISQLLN